MLFELPSTDAKSKVPSFTRRRKIPGTREFNKARVFADLTTCLPPATHYQEYYRKAIIVNAEKQYPAGKSRKPDPRPLTFLLENPRFLNNPICFTNSASTKDRQFEWWSSNMKEAPKPTPKFDRSTTFRTNFDAPKEKLRPSTRFGCNKYLNTYAIGICPVTDIYTRTPNREKISYEHQYDSRREGRERGKLHGSFVWETKSVTQSRCEDEIPSTVLVSVGKQPHQDTGQFYNLQ